MTAGGCGDSDHGDRRTHASGRGYNHQEDGGSGARAGVSMGGKTGHSHRTKVWFISSEYRRVVVGSTEALAWTPRSPCESLEAEPWSSLCQVFSYVLTVTCMAGGSTLDTRAWGDGLGGLARMQLQR